MMPVVIGENGNADSVLLGKSELGRLARIQPITRAFGKFP